jgi:GntR family transcriptional repressor for pyruvate dehydrogenase complex
MNMSILKPVSRVTLAEQVAAQISDQISRGKWKPGEKLPSETEFCAALDVGRSTLREALKSLAYVGMVQMRHGGGTYVVDQTSALIERVLTSGSLKTEKELFDMAEARLAIESETAALAAERATRGDVAELEELLKEMESSLNGKGRNYVSLDVEYHLAIARCSNNQMLHGLLTPIRGLLQEWISKSQELPGIRENAQRQHAKILAAIREQDPDKARSLMRTHLQTCEKVFNLLGRLSESKHRQAQTSKSRGRAAD